MAAVPRRVVDDATFFCVLNHVLQVNGRPELTAQSQQWAAIRVLPADRVLQILAGPGSGKTEVLVWRVLYELFVGGAASSSLMVTTFTNRAAKELQIRLVERSDSFLREAATNGFVVDDPRIHDVLVGTIHSLCDQLLAEHDPAYVENGTQLIDEAEITARLMLSYRFALGYVTNGNRVVNRLLDVPGLLALFRPPWLAENEWPRSNIDRVKFLNSLISQHTETWIPRCGPTNALNGIEPVHECGGLTADLVTLQQRWEQYLNEQKVLDFGTIQKRFIDRQHELLGIFSHVFVDEFQDSNPIQFALHTAWLGNPHCRLTVVGDDDQAVYRFRGSDIACFNELEPHCQAAGVPYRLEKLETNYRSTQAIVAFSQQYKVRTVLRTLSMPKNINHASHAVPGAPIRLLEGRWPDLCAAVASELDALRVGRIPNDGVVASETAAILMFSTSERTSKKQGPAAALELRQAIEAHGMRVYNPRNKTAGNPDTPVGMLLGLISYLIDPITKEPVGKRGQPVEVWAGHKDHSAAAMVSPPTFHINNDHIVFQKKFRKGNGRDINATPADRVPLLQYVDQVRTNLLDAIRNGTRPRLTLAGFVARLLAHAFFRNSGFTIDLFRQSLFTQLLEANIAPTRLTMQTLDASFEPSLVNNKIAWPDRYWRLLDIFGSYLSDTHLDDVEIDSFEEDAVPLITFHQTKGLEFDHVYVAAMGRAPDVTSALRTQLFSGNAVAYQVQDGHAVTADAHTLQLGEADRDRENYVALTRAKSRLTILVDPEDGRMFMGSNAAVSDMFNGVPSVPHPVVATVTVKEWPNA